jgi:RecA/RadA recombinase
MPETIKSIEDIIHDIALKKEKRLTEFYKQAKENRLKPIDPFEAYEQEQKEEKLKTGTLIDDMIGGGLESGSSILLYGEFGSGKTETCFTMAILCPDKVIYIDTEGSFRWTRIKEMCDARKIDYQAVFRKIILFQPSNWVEQMMLLNDLPSPAEEGKIGLIIVDSLTKLFRGIEFAGRQELQVKQPQIREYMIALSEIAKSYGCALVFTTQIYQSPQSNPFLPDWANEQAVGGASLQHQASYVIHFRRAQGIARIARLIDADWKPLAERPFVITERGIDNMPEGSGAAEMIKKAEEYEKKLQNLEGKKKKKTEDVSKEESSKEEEKSGV